MNQVNNFIYYKYCLKQKFHPNALNLTFLIPFFGMKNGEMNVVIEC